MEKSIFGYYIRIVRLRETESKTKYVAKVNGKPKAVRLGRSQFVKEGKETKVFKRSFFDLLEVVYYYCERAKLSKYALLYGLDIVY